MALNDNIKGALLMSLAMASFNFNDAMIKLVTGDLTTGQIMFIRGVMTSAMILLVAWRMKALRPVSVVFDRWMVLRTAGEIVGAVTYVYALSMIPLPNAAAILQALPLAVTMGAALFFAEQVGWRRWLAILVGFLGVMVIIRPGAQGFSSASLLVVGSVVAVRPDDTEVTLAARVLETEHRLYPLALRLIAEGNVRVEGERAIVSSNARFPDDVLLNPMPQMA